MTLPALLVSLQLNVRVAVVTLTWNQMDHAKQTVPNNFMRQAKSVSLVFQPV